LYQSKDEHPQQIQGDAGRHNLLPRTPCQTSHRNQTIPPRTPQTCTSCTWTYPTRSCGDIRLCSGVDSCICSTLDTLRNDLGLNRAPAETILRKTHLAACEHMVATNDPQSQSYRNTYNGPTGNRYQTLPKGQDAPRTPTSRKRTAQYEQTQETQRIRGFERDLAFNLAFYLAFSFLINISSPNLFSVTPQSHYKHI